MSNHCSFPAKLHAMLQDANIHGFDNIISWQPEGDSFMVHHPEAFASGVMQRYFVQTVKYKSFQRQLNIYGFRRVHQGPNKGAYRHRLFKRDSPERCNLVVRKSSRTKKPVAPLGAPSSSSPTNMPQKQEELGNSTTFLPLPIDSVNAAFGDIHTSKNFKTEQSSIFYQPPKLNIDDSEVKILYDIFYPEDAREQHFISSALFFDGDELTDPSFSQEGGSSIQRLESKSGSNMRSIEEELDGLLFTLESSPLVPDQDNFIIEQDRHHMTLYNHQQLHEIKSNSKSAIEQQQEQDFEDLEHTFPFKLHSMLDDAVKGGFEDIISWVEGGAAFKVHNHKAFVELIMPNYFDQTKYESFRRQLNMYGFHRVSRGENRGVVSHPSFLENNRSLCQYIERQQSIKNNTSDNNGHD